MASKPPKIKTDGTANPVTLTLGDKLKIIDELDLEASAVRNFAETGRKYSSPPIFRTPNVRPPPFYDRKIFSRIISTI